MGQPPTQAWYLPSQVRWFRRIGMRSGLVTPRNPDEHRWLIEEVQSLGFVLRSALARSPYHLLFFVGTILYAVSMLRSEPWQLAGALLAVCVVCFGLSLLSAPFVRRRIVKHLHEPAAAVPAAPGSAPAPDHERAPTAPSVAGSAERSHAPDPRRPPVVRVPRGDG